MTTDVFTRHQHTRRQMDITTDLQRFDPHWRHARHIVRRALRPCIGLCAVLDCTDPSAASAACSGGLTIVVRLLIIVLAD